MPQWYGQQRKQRIEGNKELGAKWIDEGSLHDVFADLTTLKKALCLCMAHGSTLRLSK